MELEIYTYVCSSCDMTQKHNIRRHSVLFICYIINVLRIHKGLIFAKVSDIPGLRKKIGHHPGKSWVNFIFKVNGNLLQKTHFHLILLLIHIFLLQRAITIEGLKGSP